MSENNSVIINVINAPIFTFLSINKTINDPIVGKINHTTYNLSDSDAIMENINNKKTNRCLFFETRSHISTIKTAIKALEIAPP